MNEQTTARKDVCARCGRTREDHTPIGLCIALNAVFTPARASVRPKETR